MEGLLYLATGFTAYLVGSVPTGYIVARARGIDIRGVGSGNIGATNVLRSVGKAAGSLVLAADGLKGVAACLLLPSLARGFSSAPGHWQPELLALTAGVMAVLGHNYPVWLRFKGGKGIATTAGVLLALMPGALGLCLALWLLVFAIARYVSVASIVAAAALPFVVMALHGSAALQIAAAVFSALAIMKHRSNITRLVAGTEHRFGRRQATEKNGPRP